MGRNDKACSFPALNDKACSFPALNDKARFPAGSAGFERLRVNAQYMRLGSCMLRMRLKWRFTAAAFLRLRSAVGFS